MKNGVNDGLV